MEAFETPLPRQATVGSNKVRFYHQGQQDPNKADLLCTKCYGKDHSRSKCTRPDDWCRLCQTAGHKAGEDGCDSVTLEPQEGITTVFGAHNPLSNHYPCTVKVMGHTFSSAEHAYLHTKALNTSKPEIAVKIKEAKSASEAKRISKDIPYNPDWISRREEVMETVLRAKQQQVPSFSDALLQSAGSVLVGAAAGDFQWGSGLAEKHTKVTKKNKWPGRNALGKILMKLRDEKPENKTSKKKHDKATRVHKTRSVAKGGSKHLSLVDNTQDSGDGDIDQPGSETDSEC